MIYVISIHYVTPCLSLDAGLQEAKKIPDFDSLNDTTDSTIRGMWCATQWQQAQILMIGIRSVKNCNPKWVCSKMLEKTTHLMVYQCLSACFSHWKAATFWMYTDCIPGYTRYFSIFRSIPQWKLGEFSGIRPSTSSAELANMPWRRVLRWPGNGYPLVI